MSYKMSMQSLLRRTLWFVVITLQSLFLTESVNAQSAMSPFLYCFVLAYFILMLLVLGHYLGKWYRTKLQVSSMRMIRIVAAALMLTCFCLLLPSKPLTPFEETIKVNVTATGGQERNGNGSGSAEIWLLDVIIDGNPCDLSQFGLVEGWIYREGDIITTGDTLAPLMLEFPQQDSIELVFLRHPWSGGVQIQYGSFEQELNLYSEQSERFSVPIDNQGANWLSWTPLMLVTFAAGFLLFFILNLLTLLYGEYKNRMPEASYLLASLLVVLWASSNNRQGAFILSVFTLVPSVFNLMVGNKNWHTLKYPKIFYAFFEVCTLYFTFALVGNGLFLTQLAMTITMKRVACFALSFWAMHACGYVILWVFEKVYSYTQNRKPLEDKKKILHTGMLCTSVMFVLLLIVSFGFYPGFMTPDGTSHWVQAMGLTHLTNNHPAAYTLFVRLLSKIAANPYVYTVAQIFLFSAILGAFFGFLYSKGVSKKMLFVLSVVAAIMPNNYMTLMLMSKNPLMTVLLIWLMYLLIRLIDAPVAFLRNILLIIQLTICVTAVMLVRHNTYFIFIPVTLLLVWLTVKHFKYVKFYLLLPCILSIVLLKLVTGPVYNLFGVVPLPKTPPVTSLLAPLASAAAQDISLPEDITEQMQEILPLDQWSSRYNPYNGDIFSWSLPRPDYSKTTTSKALSIYLRMLVSHSDIVIKDRLDAVETIWNIFPSDGNRSYNGKYAVGLYRDLPRELLPHHLSEIELEDSDYTYFKGNVFSKIPLQFAEFTSRYYLLDFFVWRIGIYVVLSLYVMLFALYTGNAKRIWVLMPTLVILMTLVLVIAWQIYQYTWFYSICASLFIAYCILVPSNETDQSIEAKHGGGTTI